MEMKKKQTKDPLGMSTFMIGKIMELILQPLLLWSSGGACDEKSMQSVGFYYRHKFDSQKETKSRVMKKAQIK